MPMVQTQRYCRQCQRHTLHAKHKMVSDGMGCLLTILTVGLFLPLWFLLLIADLVQPVRCQRCGRAN